MSDVVVRLAREDELDAAGALTERAYRAYGYFDNGIAPGYAVELADARPRAAAAELWVAVDADDNLLGTVTVCHPGTEYAEISRPGELEFRMLAVDPDAAGRGIGGALIQSVLDRARDLGIRRVVLCTQDRMTSVHKIYERHGFTRLPNRDWDPPRRPPHRLRPRPLTLVRAKCLGLT
jgi:GNAT superfamily N-acetyltransferase